MEHSDSLSDNTPNAAPKPSVERENNETVPAGENDDFLGGHKTSTKPRWMQTGGGKGLWLWEILSIALSLCCIVALLAILLHLDQSSLATWRFPLAPNTTISTFITIAKTSMLLAVGAGISQSKWVHFTSTKRQISDFDIFDEASRGPWGAFNFILRMKGRSALTSVGAFVIVVSLAMDPFAQQMLSFETKSVVFPGGSAYASISHAYNGPVFDTSDNYYITPEFRAAFIMGTLHSPLQWSSQCPTGNCSWPEFSTLGICASCANVTSSSQKQVVIIQNGTTRNGKPGSLQVINYTTPTGLNLYVSPGGKILSNDTLGELGTAQESTLVTSTAVKNHPSDAWWGPPVLAVAAISVSFQAGVTVQRAGDRFNYDYATPDITECSISWCVKKYKGLEVLNGAITPTSVEIVEISSREIENDKHECPEGFNYTLSTDAKTNEEENTNFTVSCDNHIFISSFLVDYLDFSLSQGLSTIDTGGASSLGLSLLSNPNVTALFEDITESLTQNIQTGPNSTLHKGTASFSEIHVIVHWPWVILPALVVIIGTVFSAVIILVNHRSDVRLWKASLKPLLFHGLDGWELDEFDVDTIGAMDKLAKEVKTQLARNEEGRLKLVRA